MTTCRAFLVAAAAAFLLGCGGDEPTHEITDVRERQAARPPMRVSSAQRFGLDMRNPHGGGGHGGGGAHGGGAPDIQFSWDLPEGWKEKPPTDLRRANFEVGGDPDAECYLTLLPGAAGGVEANVNRWVSQQMGQPALSADAIAALPQRLFLGRQATLVDVEGTFKGMSGPAQEGFRMVGLIFAAPQVTVFLKMTGPKATVGKEIGRFEKLAATMRVGAGDDAPPPSAPAFTWTAPKTWTEAPPRGERIVTFKPQDDADAECYIIVMGGAAGGINANLNLWRSQVALPPLDAAELTELPKIEILGGEATLLEVYGSYSGKSDEKVEKAGLVGAIRPLPGRTLFVKLVGEADVVRKEKENFLAFCRSLTER